jgi:hypothetical protein
MRLRERLLLIWLVLFTALTFYALRESSELADENRNRIVEIQLARASSCRQTYEGVREVFRPLFPPQPDEQTQDRLDTFNQTIDDLKAACVKQTNTQEEP